MYLIFLINIRQNPVYESFYFPPGMSLKTSFIGIQYLSASMLLPLSSIVLAVWIIEGYAL